MLNRKVCALWDMCDDSVPRKNIVIFDSEKLHVISVLLNNKDQYAEQHEEQGPQDGYQ